MDIYHFLAWNEARPVLASWRPRLKKLASLEKAWRQYSARLPARAHYNLLNFVTKSSTGEVFCYTHKYMMQIPVYRLNPHTAEISTLRTHVPLNDKINRIMAQPHSKPATIVGIVVFNNVAHHDAMVRATDNLGFIPRYTEGWKHDICHVLLWGEKIETGILWQAQFCEPQNVLMHSTRF